MRLGTVFSGIGAIEHAIMRLGITHSIKFACDNDKFVKEAYFANYDINKLKWYEDIVDIDGEKYRDKIDLFVGGNPCQSFSMIGKRNGLDDERGNLVFEFIRLVSEIRPKVFIFENVKGLLSHDSGNTFEIIKRSFESLGYFIEQTVMNAKDYGIPQNRERLFVIGFDKKLQFKFPKPISLIHTMNDFLEKSCDNKYFLPEKGVAFVTNEKNLTKRYTQINGDIALCQKRHQQFNWHGDFVFSNLDKYYLSDKVKKYVLSSGTKNFYSKPEIDLNVARPLLSTMAKMHRAGVDNYISNGEKLRKLTPRECMRLMGFADSYKIVVSDTQAYKQAGNSIVVDVLIHLLNNIIDTGIFNKKKYKKATKENSHADISPT